MYFFLIAQEKSAVPAFAGGVQQGARGHGVVVCELAFVDADRLDGELLVRARRLAGGGVAGTGCVYTGCGATAGCGGNSRVN